MPLRSDTNHLLHPCNLSLNPIKLLAFSQSTHLLSCPQTLELDIMSACDTFPDLVRLGNLTYPSGAIQMSTLLWNFPHFFPQAWCSSILYNTWDIFSSPNWCYIFKKTSLSYSSMSSSKVRTDFPLPLYHRQFAQSTVQKRCSMNVYGMDIGLARGT